MEILTVEKANNGYAIRMFKESFELEKLHVVLTKEELIEIVITFLQSEDE